MSLYVRCHEKREGDQLRLFGLDIVPAKKVDQREAKVFDKIVMEHLLGLLNIRHGFDAGNTPTCPHFNEYELVTIV